MTPPLVLADLDDTLFQTEGKCPSGERGHLVQATVAGNGRHSFTTRRQRALLDWLFATAEVVPVTARGTQAFSTVTVPFAHGAVLANGAVILGPDGAPDAGWRRAMEASLAAYAGDLADILDRGRAAASDLGLDVRSWTVEEDGLDCYSVFKDNADANGAGLAPLAAAVPTPEGWTRHRNGNNLAFLPPCLSKRAAAMHLIDRARAADPSRVVLGMGDSLTDVPFMDECDWLCAPRASQVAGRLRTLRPVEGETTP